MAAKAVYDLAILGAGPGGYTSALRAAQRGLRVALIESDRVGGVCLNRGCIPTKVGIKAADYVRAPSSARSFGVMLGTSTIDLPALRHQQAKVVQWLASGVEAALYQRQVDVIIGHARLAPDGMVSIDGPDGHTVIRASTRLVATGARERPFPLLPLDGHRIIGSTDALQLERLPASLAVVGAGAVGTEFASMYADFGCQVTLIEALPNILPLEDRECGQLVAEALQNRGVRILTGAPVSSQESSAEGVVLTCGPENTLVEAEQVLVAVGRVPNTEDLGLESLGISTVRGYIPVDDDYRTIAPDVYAIGDCVPTLALAHVAAAEGRYVADLVAGTGPTRLRPQAFPHATYCHPEIASVGLSEEQARAQGLDVIIGRLPMRANGKAAIYGEMEGVVKVIAEAGSRVIRGIHVVGPSASEIIGEASLALSLEADAREIAESVHAHPTVSEALMEAAEAALG